MHKEEIKRLVGKTEQKGFTLVPLDLHYKGGRIKLEVGLAKGKKQYDKRDAERELWDGYRHGPEAACERFGFDEAYPVSELDARMPGLISDQPALYCAIGEDAWQKGELSAVESALERLSREFGSASWFCIDAERGRFGWAFAHSGSLQRAWCGDGAWLPWGLRNRRFELRFPGFAVRLS
jgi:hypothetical protein